MRKQAAGMSPQLTYFFLLPVVSAGVAAGTLKSQTE
jgi:hypothetical protein